MKTWSPLFPSSFVPRTFPALTQDLLTACPSPRTNMFRPPVSSLSTIHLALLLLTTPATSDPCTFNNTAACDTQQICTPIEYTKCLIAHNSITASIACIGEANKLLTNWWNEPPTNPNTCNTKNPDADDDTNDIDNFLVSFGQEFVKAADSLSCNCSPGGAISDCHMDWTDDAAFAKCLCQDGVSNNDLRCLHSCLQATGVEYCFSDFCNAGAKAGTLFDQAVLGSCKNPTNEAASGGDSGAADTSDAPAAATSVAASSSALSSTVSPSSPAATANQAASPSSTLPSSFTSATTSPTKSGSEARRIKASELGYLFLMIYIVR